MSIPKFDRQYPRLVEPRRRQAKEALLGQREPLLQPDLNRHSSPIPPLPSRQTLTRLAALATLSRGAGEGLRRGGLKLLSRTAGEGGPSPKGVVGEGSGWGARGL